MSIEGPHQRARSPEGVRRDAALSEGDLRAPVLSVDKLTKAFDGVDAVRDVSFTIGAGELVALIGPNGAGKTTCFNLVNGQLRPDSGRISLMGSRIDGLPPRAISRMGVGRTFQIAALFASMTVRENVQLALLAREGRHQRIGTRATDCMRSEADALLERVRMTEFAGEGCATLAYGNAKRVELALALASKPRLLLMDEPTAGMSPRSRGRLMELAASLAREEQIAVLFTEHDMDVVFGHADRVIVLDRGQVIAQGMPEAIRANAKVQAVYLGDSETAKSRD
jgi:branched-chain amino acid transport system ATP-binding protein